MNIIRIYLSPKGYKDIVCTYVDVIPATKQCVVHGGLEDGKVYENSRGAKAIRETAGIQLSLFDEEN